MPLTIRVPHSYVTSHILFYPFAAGWSKMLSRNRRIQNTDIDTDDQLGLSNSLPDNHMLRPVPDLRPVGALQYK